MNVYLKKQATDSSSTIMMILFVLLMSITMSHGSNGEINMAGIGTLTGICNVSHISEILQHPKSKLVPAGVHVSFHCKLSDKLHSYWVVDGSPGVTPQHRSILERKGFFISNISQDGIITLSLTVTASMDKNGTVVFCSSVEELTTDKAVLLVIESKC